MNGNKQILTVCSLSVFTFLTFGVRKGRKNLRSLFWLIDIFLRGEDKNSSLVGTIIICCMPQIKISHIHCDSLWNCQHLLESRIICVNCNKIY